MTCPIIPDFRINSIYFDNNDSQLVINDKFRMYFLKNSGLQREHICGFWKFYPNDSDKDTSYPKPILFATSLENKCYYSNIKISPNI
jgi:hypothetical protein